MALFHSFCSPFELEFRRVLGWSTVRLTGRTDRGGDGSATALYVFCPGEIETKLKLRIAMSKQTVAKNYVNLREFDPY